MSYINQSAYQQAYSNPISPYGFAAPQPFQQQQQLQQPQQPIYSFGGNVIQTQPIAATSVVTSVVGTAPISGSVVTSTAPNFALTQSGFATAIGSGGSIINGMAVRAAPPPPQTRDVRTDKRVYLYSVIPIKTETNRDELEQVDTAIVNAMLGNKGVLRVNFDIDGDFSIYEVIFQDRFAFLDHVHFFAREPHNFFDRRMSMLNTEAARYHVNGVSRDDPAIPESYKLMLKSSKNSTLSRSNLGFIRN
jgi:hypothetical protein